MKQFSKEAINQVSKYRSIRKKEAIMQASMEAWKEGRRVSKEATKHGKRPPSMKTRKKERTQQPYCNFCFSKKQNKVYNVTD